MDAKVLKAAVSAAIRVTVSTTLMGCGGSVSTDAGRSSPSPAVKDTATDAHGSVASGTAGTSGQTNSAPLKPTQGSGGQTTLPVETSAGNAGTAGGASVEVGGMASAAGAGGEPGGAGAPPDVCGNAAAACVTKLGEQPFEETPSDATNACCETILARLDELRLEPGAACFDHLDQDFMQSPARRQCCKDPSTWQNPACTPWGPPVPPEISREALQAWSLAA
ncbi:MAG TPA: hypothetical protein VHP33_12650 [Polyangiaceae bacterium]|nr:hypothetical protein [Polyangiaceae bacterium]